MDVVKGKVPNPQNAARDESPKSAGSLNHLSAQEPPSTYIENPGDLKRVVKHFGAFPRLAVDLEADSMFHYREQVCLIQMAVEGQGVLVDPLVLPDLEPLKPIFTDPSILKIFHGADYDIRSLYRDFTISVGPIFDTELAARFLGYHHSGLEAMVKEILNIKLDKRFQKKDWSQRPLPPEMVVYALGDACYLLPLSKILEQSLKDKGRWEWVQEECNLLSRVRSPGENNDPLFVRFKGAGKLKPRELAVLENLLQLRDRMACRKDRPWFKIIGNPALMTIAQKQPISLKALKQTRALSHRQLDMYGDGVIACVEAALALTAKELPKYPRRRVPKPDPAFSERMQVLKQWRDCMAKRLELDGSLLCNKALMGRIAAAQPRDMESLAQMEGIRRWQLEEFGTEILDILAKINPPPKGRRRRRGKN